VDIQNVFKVMPFVYVASLLPVIFAFRLLRHEFKEKTPKNALYKITIILASLEFAAMLLMSAGILIDADFARLVYLIFALTFFEVYPLGSLTAFLPLTSGFWIASVIYARRKGLPAPDYTCSLIINLYPALASFSIWHSCTSFAFLVMLMLFGRFALKSDKTHGVDSDG